MSIYLFIYLFIFASKEAYSIVRQLEKNNGQKSASESSKMREKQILGPKDPPGHFSIKYQGAWKAIMLINNTLDFRQHVSRII